MPTTITLLVSLLVVVVGLSALATRLAIPSPIVLVIGGVLLSVLPGLPPIDLAPDLVLFLFLPPLIYASAWQSSWRDFQANLRLILLLAIGLVLVTTTLVAVVAHFLVGLPWGVAFVLGAIVSPTDAVAASATAQRVGLAALISPLVVAPQILRLDIPVMIVVSGLLLILAFDQTISRVDGALLVAGLLLYTGFTIVQSRKASARLQAEFAAEYGTPRRQAFPTTLAQIGLVVFGLALLTLGAHWLVDGAVAFATLMGVSELIIGLTIVARFGAFVSAAGLRHTPVRADFLQLIETPEGKAALAGGNPLRLMQRVMPMLRQLLDDCWQAAPGSDAIIYHPKALGGYHIAEKLGIPGILAHPVPLFSATRAFPSPVLPVANLGGR